MPNWHKQPLSHPCGKGKIINNKYFQLW
jgi:hypothetical protein